MGRRRIPWITLETTNIPIAATIDMKAEVSGVISRTMR